VKGQQATDPRWGTAVQEAEWWCVWRSHSLKEAPFPYSIDQSNAVAVQLEKFTTSFAHHLVGHVANLEFWLDEVVHSIGVLDDYGKRFVRMRDAQIEWVRAHGTRIDGYCQICRGKCEFGPFTPSPPRRVASQEIEAARRRLKDAAYQFLLRCFRAGHLDQAALSSCCARVGTSLEPIDLDR
jgi:hypothetical protein